MKRGQFETRQILTLFEIIIVVVVIISFVIMLKGDSPTKFNDIDKELEDSVARYSENYLDSVEVKEKEKSNFLGGLT